MPLSIFLSRSGKHLYSLVSHLPPSLTSFSLESHASHAHWKHSQTPDSPSFNSTVFRMFNKWCFTGYPHNCPKGIAYLDIAYLLITFLNIAQMKAILSRGIQLKWILELSLLLVWVPTRSLSLHWQLPISFEKESDTLERTLLWLACPLIGP